MPYSSFLEEQFHEVADRRIGAIHFDTGEEIIPLCIRLKVGILTKFAFAAHIEAKFQADWEDIQELIESGFECYATDKIIHFTTTVQIGASKYTPLTHIPAFTPERLIQNPHLANSFTDAEKILEARNEFKKIITSRLKQGLDRLIQLNFVKRQEYIDKQKQQISQAKQLQELLVSRSAPSVEKKTLTEQEWLEQEAIRFDMEVEAREAALNFGQDTDEEEEDEEENVEEDENMPMAISRSRSPRFFSQPLLAISLPADDEAQELAETGEMRP